MAPLNLHYSKFTGGIHQMGLLGGRPQYN